MNQLQTSIEKNTNRYAQFSNASPWCQRHHPACPKVRPSIDVRSIPVSCLHTDAVQTVELIIDQKPWVPQNTPIEFLNVYVEEREEEIKQCVQVHGGIWDEERHLWQLPAYKVHMLGMEHRVVPEIPFPNPHMQEKRAELKE